MEFKEVAFGDFRFSEFIPKEQIDKIVTHLAQKISQDYKEKNPLFIVVLNGAFVFAADLLRAIEIDCQTSFVKLKSYDGLSSTGQVEKVLGLEIDIAGRHVVIVEDIIDTGNTLNAFLEDLKKYKTKSLSLVTLLFKPHAFKHTYPINYVGLEIPDQFVIGYGMDYNDQGRNLSSIYQKKA